MAGPVIRCVLVSFAVLAVLQNIAGTHGHGLRGFDNDCESEMAFCFYPALLRYSALNSEETLEKAREAPLSTHCKEWSGAVQCGRHLKSRACHNTTSLITDKVIKYVKVIDLFVDYACKENPHGMNNAYRCLLVQTVINDIAEQVLSVDFNKHTVCDKLPTLIAVASKSVAGSCGPDAGKVGKELFTKTSEAFLEFMLDRKCLSKHEGIPVMVERHFSRK